MLDLGTGHNSPRTCVSYAKQLVPDRRLSIRTTLPFLSSSGCTIRGDHIAVRQSQAVACRCQFVVRGITFDELILRIQTAFHHEERIRVSIKIRLIKSGESEFVIGILVDLDGITIRHFLTDVIRAGGRFPPQLEVNIGLVRRTVDPNLLHRRLAQFGNLVMVRDNSIKFLTIGRQFVAGCCDIVIHMVASKAIDA